MLERIEKIQGVGLLHDLNGKACTMHKATLIYADNGRGKSTLAAVMRAGSSGSAAPIEERRTLDGKIQPAVALRFTDGVGVEYVDGKWTKACPEMLIFDGNFIDENVHSGGSVSPGQRKNLLQFALGTAAVDARNREEKATAEASKATELVRQVTAQLAGYHRGMSLSAFVKLAPPSDVDTQILDLQKQLATATSLAEVLKRPVPREIPLPPLDLRALFAILRTSLDDIQQDAEVLVKAHLSNCADPDLESWISSGQRFESNNRCPYCDQDTHGLALVSAYRTYFNVAYEKLKAQVALLRRGIDVRLGNQVLEAFTEQLRTANAQCATWSQDINFEAPVFDSLSAQVFLGRLNHSMSGMVVNKEQRPTDSVGTDKELLDAEQLWGAIQSLMLETNVKIRDCSNAIESFKKRIGQAQPSAIQSKIDLLNASKQRVDPKVVALLTYLGQLQQREAEGTTTKKAARQELDTVMSKTLGAYEKAINQLLIKFSASFCIEKMDANFRGGAPRTEYGIRIRGKSVALEGGVPKFATALSDGDKRTLAFAFFVASSLADPLLGSKIIVVDDPMCSLDLNRRVQTKAVLKILHDKADQLLVFAHDPFFIRGLRDELRSKDGKSQIALFQLCYAEHGYTQMSKFLVDRECESPYFRHHRMVTEYCAGTDVDHRNVAVALRPLLEGYVHRRFPGLIPQGNTLGVAINFIKSSTPPSPVVFAHHIVDELHDLNDYAGLFHHDTNPGNADHAPVVPTELRTFCERSLRLIYSGQCLS